MTLLPGARNFCWPWARQYVRPLVKKGLRPLVKKGLRPLVKKDPFRPSRPALRSRASSAHRALSPLGIRDTDRNAPQQKPHVERNHEEIRRVLVKGSSFDALTQGDVSLMLSHVNSAPRPSLDGKTPYDEFVSSYGERGREFLEKLGIRRVNAESVVLDPILLGERFKKEANRAILHRHGVL